MNLVVPHLFLLSLLQMCLIWRFVSNAHVRTLTVVELYETGNECPCVFKGGQLFPRIDAFRLQYAIDTLCNGIVRRLIVLCHGDCNAVAFQHGHIRVTAILDTTVGMVNEFCEALSSAHLCRLVYGHLQSLHADGSLQSVRQSPSDHLVGVGISDQMQVTDITVCQSYIGYVSNPKLVGRCENSVSMPITRQP